MPAYAFLLFLVQWCGRMGNAMAGACFGLVLFVAAFPLLVWNEGNFVNQAIAIDEVKGLLQEADITTIDKSLNGKAIHLSGPLDVPEIADAEFGVHARALQITRSVEARVYVESSTSSTQSDGRGGEVTTTTYSHSEQWQDRIPSGFKDPSFKGRNPTGFRVSESRMLAKDAKIGAYKLPRAAIEGLGRSSPVDLLDPKISDLGRALAPPNGGAQLSLPSGPTKVKELISMAKKNRNLQTGDGAADSKSSSAVATIPTFSKEIAAMTLYDNQLYTGNPLAPVVGDNRVSFSISAPEYASIIGRQRKDGGLEPVVTSNGREILIFSEGELSPNQLFNKAHTENTVMTWALRGGGWLAMWIGLMILFNPITIMPEIVPLVGGILGSVTSCTVGLMAFGVATSLSLITIAISWFAFRPLVSIGLLIAAAAILYISRSLSRYGRKPDAAPKQD